MLVFLCSVALFLCLVHIIFNYNEKARMLRKIPGMKDSFIVGNAFEVLVSPVELMKLGRKFASTWDGIYRFWAFPIGVINIFNPDDVELILSSMKYNDKSPVYKFLKPWLRDGLLVSNGALWQHRRKILTPAFHFSILRQFFVIFQENSHRLVKSLEKRIGETVDVIPVLSEFTLHSICETAMGTQLSEETTGAGRTYKNAILGLVKIFLHRFLRIILYSDFIFNLTSMGGTQSKYLEIVHSFTQRVIKDRKEYIEEHGVPNIDDTEDDDSHIYKKKKKTAMLDLLISAEKEGLIDNMGIQAEVDTFMFEGHDTTASGLTFCLMSIANDRQIQARIVEELHEIFGDSKRGALMEDLNKMKYLECCIKETLRLYPPVHFISRHLKETVVLSGHTIPAGTFCHIHIYDLHRREDIFKNPLEFNPDRFLPENCVGRHPFAYVPFSAGPRNCIGQKFAMMELKLAIAEVLREFELLPITRHEDLEFTADVILRNSAPVYVKFLKRN